MAEAEVAPRTQTTRMGGLWLAVGMVYGYWVAVSELRLSYHYWGYIVIKIVSPI